MELRTKLKGLDGHKLFDIEIINFSALYPTNTLKIHSVTGSFIDNFFIFGKPNKYVLLNLLRLFNENCNIKFWCSFDTNTNMIPFPLKFSDVTSSEKTGLNGVINEISFIANSFNPYYEQEDEPYQSFSNQGIQFIVTFLFETIGEQNFIKSVKSVDFLPYSDSEISYRHQNLEIQGIEFEPQNCVLLFPKKPNLVKFGWNTTNTTNYNNIAASSYNCVKKYDYYKSIIVQ